MPDLIHNFPVAIAGMPSPRWSTPDLYADDLSAGCTQFLPWLFGWNLNSTNYSRIFTPSVRITRFGDRHWPLV
jgi:hypothetical protein